ncbi:MAG TPA: ABC transporter ATP-binding protein [Phycisphaerae bacterium]|nr:ABC transporter ATP-binding protein [Phycisphaerae bacterium]HNU44664.1 ABC transporter ATP-binding protein [Phycisphaerae bacterium]
MARRVLPVVQTAGLCKTFKDFWRRPRVEAVKNLDLEIRPGEVVGLLGPNGSGKTTTIKMLLGLLYPTRGRISLFGKAPTDVAVKSRIGFLPEESYLYRFLGAQETLDHFGRLFRLPTHVRRDRTERLLDMVGLRHQASRPVGEFSKGMARRIGLAQALINDPEFLILDEPTSGLDPIGSRQIKDLVRELGRKGKTILLSSHILADVEDVCNRVVILYGGLERAQGDISALLSQKDRMQLTTPVLTPETLAEVRRLLHEREQADVLHVSHPRDRLEAFFLRIVEEAQAASVGTSGARGGGVVPEFLKKATQADAQEVVESLIAAARQPLPAQVESRRERATGEPIESGREAARAVIDELLGVQPAPAAPEVDEPRLPVEPAPRPAEAPRAAPRADRKVIEELLGGTPPGEGEGPQKEEQP